MLTVYRNSDAGRASAAAVAASKADCRAEGKEPERRSSGSTSGSSSGGVGGASSSKGGDNDDWDRGGDRGNKASPARSGYGSYGSSPAEAKATGANTSISNLYIPNGDVVDHAVFVCFNTAHADDSMHIPRPTCNM